jgi:uncharacterized lipoprotein YmbA
MKASNLFALFILLITVAGCSIPQQPAPSKSQFLLNIETKAQNPLPTLPCCLHLRTVSVQSPFSGTALIYRTGALTYQKDYYNQFLTAPDQQLNDLLPLWLRSTGVVLCAGGMDSGDKRLILEPHLEALYADFQTPPASAALVRMRFVLTQVDRSCRCSTIVLDKTLESSVPLPPKPSAEAVVKAMSNAIADILTQFETTMTMHFQ